MISDTEEKLPAMDGRRHPDDPTAAERAQIARRTKLLPLCRRDMPGVLDWPSLASRLADELAELAARLADDPHATAADLERVERARAVVRDYQTAAQTEIDQ